MRATHVEDSCLGDMGLPGDSQMRATHVEDSCLGDMGLPGDSQMRAIHVDAPIRFFLVFIIILFLLWGLCFFKNKS